MITLVCGLPGSGKSAWAREKQKNEGGYVIDADELIANMQGSGAHEGNARAEIYYVMGDILWAIANRLDGAGENTVMIRTAPGEDEYIANARKCARVIIDTPPEKCVERIRKRQAGISEARFAQAQARFNRFAELHGHEFRRITEFETERKLRKGD